MDQTAEDWIDVGETLRILRCSRATLDRWRARRGFPRGRRTGPGPRAPLRFPRSGIVAYRERFLRDSV